MTTERKLQYDFQDYPGTCCGVGELGAFYFKVPGRYDNRQGIIEIEDPVLNDKDKNNITHHIEERVVATLIEDREGGLCGEYLLNAYTTEEDTPESWRTYFNSTSCWEKGTSFTNVKTGNVVTPYSWLMSFDRS